MSVLTVPLGTGSLRLDRFLTSHVPGCSRRTAQRAIAAGTVRVNGHRARKGDLVAAGDTVDVPEDLCTPPPLQPNPQLAVRVLYEDAALIAIDKPAGMPSLALRADETDTAANFLLAHDPTLAGIGKSDREPGLLHRLDTDTSGVLLAARTVPAYRAVRRQFTAHQVKKEYLAVVHGDIAVAGEVRVPIAHERHNRRKMRACTSGASSDARPATTRYSPVERLGQYTVLAIDISTGVTHQIRVHLALIGHPIVGDRLYGGELCEGDPARHLLHATRVTVMHPQTGRSLTVDSVPPADFRGYVDRLRKKRGPSAGRPRRAARQPG